MASKCIKRNLDLAVNKLIIFVLYTCISFDYETKSLFIPQLTLIILVVYPVGMSVYLSRSIYKQYSNKNKNPIHVSISTWAINHILGRKKNTEKVV